MYHRKRKEKKQVRLMFMLMRLGARRTFEPAKQNPRRSRRQGLLRWMVRGKPEPGVAPRTRKNQQSAATRFPQGDFMSTPARLYTRRARPLDRCRWTACRRCAPA